jgi:hypothetical protein
MLFVENLNSLEMNERNQKKYLLYASFKNMIMKSKKITIIIPGLHLIILVILALPVFGQQIKINAGAYLKNAGNAYIKINNVDIINNGNYVKGTESVDFSGTAAKTISGSSNTDMYDLLIANTGGITSQLGLLSTHNLTIGTGSKLTVDPAKAITAGGTTTLGSSQCLVLKSNASGTASFRDNGTISGSGTAKVERYLTPYQVQNPTDWRYHFLSSPVENQAIQTEFVNLPNTTDDFYSWSEPTNMWINTKVGATPPYSWNSAFESNFIQGKGYLVAYPSTVTKNFIGKPYTSAAGLTMTCTTTSDGGWNLLGNPFPSAVDWDGVSKGSGMDAALYYYDNSAPRYRYYISLTGGIGNSYSGGARYIPPMQGFMVHSKSSGITTITMDNSDRVHESLTTYYKDAPLINNVLNIWVEGNNSRDDARVCYYERASMNFDGEYDAYKLFSYNNTIPELYSVTPDNTQLAINTLPLSEMYADVTLGFMPGTPGNFTFSADGINTFSEETYIFLKDLKTGTIQKLNDNPSYSFIATAGDNTSRFVLHFQDATSISNSDLIKDFAIYQEEGFITVLKAGTLVGHVIVSDIAGRRIGLASLTESSPTRIQVQGSGVYIVSIISNSGVSNSKIFVK